MMTKMIKLKEDLNYPFFYVFNFEYENNLIKVFFDKKSLDLIGWETKDVYQNLIQTFITDIKRKKPLPYNEKVSSNSLYLRLEVKDKPGVLSEITKLLANNKISIERVIQIPDHKKKSASIIIITHRAIENRSQNLINSLKRNNNIIKKPVQIRLF